MTSSINEKIVNVIKEKKAEDKIAILKMQNAETILKQVQEINAEEIEQVVRARDKKGHYISDDPSTPDINEAYKDGKTPKKSVAKKTVAKKSVAKKTVAKKKTTKKAK